MKSLAVIQQEIGLWSRANFGAQVSKTLVYRHSYFPLDIPLPLGSLAPLLGIGEETCEFLEASTEEDCKDALADIGVYLCDYATREEYTIEEITLDPEQAEEYEDGFSNVTKGLQDLLHCTLKRHQGIRGFEDKEKYIQYRNRAIQQIVLGLYEYSLATWGISYLLILNEVWDKVSKRNWVANPQNAHQVEG